MYSYSDRFNNNTDLEDLAEKSLRGWIPCQTSVIDKISAKISRGEYGNSPKLLIEDLKQDISTYLYIIRAFLDRSAIDELNNSAKDKTPFKIMLPLLEKIKASHGDDRLKKSSEFQLELLKESVLASTTVEALASSFALDKGFAYSISGLRSLGKLLIAWNFPVQFHKSVELLNQNPENTSLDIILTNTLGHSPAQIGAKVGQKLGLSNGIHALLQNPTHVVQTSNSTTSVHNRLSCLCGFGEQFSMAHSTIPHNISKKNMTEVLEIISSSIGNDGLKNIYDKTNGALNSYKSSNPSKFKLFSDAVVEKGLNPSEISLRTEITKLARRADIKNMPLLNEILSDFEKPTNRPIAIRKLVSDLLPAEKVDSLVLYTIDPVEKDLIPVCKKGRPSFVRIKEACPIFGAMTNSLIKDVFDSRTSHQVEGLNSMRKDAIATIAPYPSKKPYGVLYIESEKSKVGKDKLNALSNLATTLLSKLYEK